MKHQSFLFFKLKVSPYFELSRPSHYVCMPFVPDCTKLSRMVEKYVNSIFRNRSVTSF